MIRNNDSSSHSVGNLQTMLQMISRIDPQQQNVIPNGNYDADTVAAVTCFQRNHSLASTGITDEETWNEITRKYEDALLELSPAERPEIEIPCGQCFCKGDQGSSVRLMQCMLSEISEKYKSIAPVVCNGIMEETTENAVSEFQKLCNLEPTGRMNKKTWYFLCMHYPCAVSFQR